MSLDNPTELFRKKDGSHVIIDRWIKGPVELYIIKFPPILADPTTFSIIGRANSDEKFEEHGKPSITFIKKYEIFKDLILQLDASYTATGRLR